MMSEKRPEEDVSKLLNQNKEILSGVLELQQKLKAISGGMTPEEWLDKLRREASGQ